MLVESTRHIEVELYMDKATKFGKPMTYSYSFKSPFLSHQMSSYDYDNYDNDLYDEGRDIYDDGSNNESYEEYDDEVDGYESDNYEEYSYEDEYAEYDDDEDGDDYL